MTIKEKSIILKIKKSIFKIAGDTKYDFFLFGSRVNNTAKERSDYDIGVIGDKKLDPILKSQLEDEFNNIPALIDFIDFTQTSESFNKIATENIFWLKK